MQSEKAENDFSDILGRLWDERWKALFAEPFEGKT
jgi:hypothetical protein